MTENFVDDVARKSKNSQQDTRLEAETAKDYAEEIPNSTTLNKTKEKVKDALS